MRRPRAKRQASRRAIRQVRQRYPAPVSRVGRVMIIIQLGIRVDSIRGWREHQAETLSNFIYPTAANEQFFQHDLKYSTWSEFRPLL